MYSYLPHTDEIRAEILQSMGLSNIDELFGNIDSKAKLQGLMDMPEGLNEIEAKSKLVELADKNTSTSQCASFLGGGTYNRFIPSCINNIVQRSEFITSYTPYQPEVSQGTLQVMYEYQTMICNLTGMDIANASVYDGATACAEAVLMASRIAKKQKVLISSLLNPNYKKVIETYCYGVDIEVDYLEYINEIKEEYACVLVQNPNYLGSIEELSQIGQKCEESKAKFIVCVDPASLAVIEPPSSFGADIVVGDLQPLSIPQSFGGPHGGFIACREKYLRQMPGRIAGMTVDEDGKRAFTLTLQAREQHIKRARATSNICTNQALMALSSTIYLSVMGYEGLKEVMLISAKKAHKLADCIDKIAGFKVISKDYLYEFVLKVDEKISSKLVLDELQSKGILGGISLDSVEGYSNCILVSVTEMNADSDIENYISELKLISLRHNLNAEWSTL